MVNKKSNGNKFQKQRKPSVLSSKFLEILKIKDFQSPRFKFESSDKKGVSPIVSTVLLIMIVIVIAGIIVMWSKGFIKEALSKEVGGEEKEVNQVCSEITASAIINNDGTYGINNNGNVPIYALDVKIIKDDGSSSIIKIEPADGGSVNPGQSAMINKEDYNNYEDYLGVKIIPVIIGTSKSSGEYKEFTCPESNSITIK